MSEETKVEETQQAPENQNVQISVEQILAGVLKTLGAVTVKIEDLVANYSTKTIKVDQLEDGSVKFELVDIPVETDNATEQTSE